MKKYKKIDLRKKKKQPTKAPYVISLFAIVGIAWLSSGDNVAGQRIEKVQPLRVVDIIELAEKEMANEVQPVVLKKIVKPKKSKKPVDEQEIKALTLLLYGTDEEAKQAQKMLLSNIK